MDDINKHKKAKLSVLLAVILCAYQSLTKGWFSLLLLPLSVLLLPVFVIIQIVSFRQNSGPYVEKINMLSSILTVSIISFYIFLPGFGDTEEVFLFGFYRANSEDFLAKASYVISVTAFLFIPLVFIALVIYLIINHKKKSKISEPINPTQPTKTS